MLGNIWSSAGIIVSCFCFVRSRQGGNSCRSAVGLLLLSDLRVKQGSLLQLTTGVDILAQYGTHCECRKPPGFSRIGPAHPGSFFFSIKLLWPEMVSTPTLLAINGSFRRVIAGGFTSAEGFRTLYTTDSSGVVPTFADMFNLTSLRD